LDLTTLANAKTVKSGQMHPEFKPEAMRLFKGWHAALVTARILGVTVQPSVELVATGVRGDKVESH